jgi:hypothetical protein
MKKKIIERKVIPGVHLTLNRKIDFQKNKLILVNPLNQTNLKIIDEILIKK